MSVRGLVLNDGGNLRINEGTLTLTTVETPWERDSESFGETRNREARDWYKRRSQTRVSCNQTRTRILQVVGRNPDIEFWWEYQKGDRRKIHTSYTYLETEGTDTGCTIIRTRFDESISFRGLKSSNLSLRQPLRVP